MIIVKNKLLTLRGRLGLGIDKRKGLKMKGFDKGPWKNPLRMSPGTEESKPSGKEHPLHSPPEKDTSQERVSPLKERAKEQKHSEETITETIYNKAHVMSCREMLSIIKN